ncbi:hypothetical protein GCM10028787_07510 [Brachybacterium horti]
MPVPRSVEPRPAHRPAPSRRALMRGAAWSVPVVAAASAAPAFAVSCVSGQFDGIGRGRILSGQLINIGLGEESTPVELASLNGVIASTPDGGYGTAVAPSNLPSVDARADVLDVELLDTLNIDLGTVTPALSSILQLVADQGVGAYNQFALADREGVEKGASGLVDGSGVIQLDGPGGAGMPEFGTIDLRSLLNSPLLGSFPVVGALVNTATGVDALSLSIGALAASAIAEQNCEPDVAAELTRKYLVAHLLLTVVPASDSLVAGVFDTLTNLTVDIDAGALLDDVLDAINAIPVLGPVAYGLIQSTAQIEASVSVSTESLGDTIPAPTGGPQPLSISLSDGGKIVIDLAEAAGVGYDSSGDYLNTAAPNSTLFVDTTTQGATNAVASVVDGITTWLFDSLLSAVSVNIKIKAGVGLLGAMVDVVTISGPLNDLDVKLLIINLGSTGANVIRNTVRPLIEGALRTALTNALEPLHDLLGSVFSLLVDVIQIQLNAQNDPGANNAPATPDAFAEPSGWSGLTSGRYDVAALHLSVVGALDVLDLYLARGSVGPTSQVASSAAPAATPGV